MPRTSINGVPTPSPTVCSPMRCSRSTRWPKDFRTRSCARTPPSCSPSPTTIWGTTRTRTTCWGRSPGCSRTPSTSRSSATGRRPSAWRRGGRPRRSSGPSGNWSARTHLRSTGGAPCCCTPPHWSRTAARRMPSAPTWPWSTNCRHRSRPTRCSGRDSSPTRPAAMLRRRRPSGASCWRMRAAPARRRRCTRRPMPRCWPGSPLQRPNASAGTWNCSPQVPWPERRSGGFRSCTSAWRSSHRRHSGPTRRWRKGTRPTSPPGSCRSRVRRRCSSAIRRARSAS